MNEMKTLSGSAMETKTSTPGRSDLPCGLVGDGCSNLSRRAPRSVARLMGFSFGS